MFILNFEITSNSHTPDEEGNCGVSMPYRLKAAHFDTSWKFSDIKYFSVGNNIWIYLWPKTINLYQFFINIDLFAAKLTSSGHGAWAKDYREHVFIFQRQCEAAQWNRKVDTLSIPRSFRNDIVHADPSIWLKLICLSERMSK